MKKKLAPLNNIPFLVCLLLLLLNDFCFKSAYHNWLTGKLSDFCGLFVFAWFWTVFFPNRKRIVFFSIALLFVLWKSPFSQPFIDCFSQYAFPIYRAVDLTDLLALSVLPVAFFYQPNGIHRLKINPTPIALLSVISFSATSIIEPTQVFKPPQYILFKSGITTLESRDYPSEYIVYGLDTVVVIAIKEIMVEERATLNDDFHKIQILKDLDLRLLRDLQEMDWPRGDLMDYVALRDSLTISGSTFVTLELDSIREELQFNKTRLHGRFKRFSNEGKLSVVGKYKHGVEDSIWTFYNTKGEIALKKYYENGEKIKVQLFEKSKLKSEERFNTRKETIRDKYFHIAIIVLLMAGLVSKLYLNYKKSVAENSILKYSNLFKILGILVLPLVTLVLSPLLSALIPTAYSPYFLEPIAKAVLVYMIMVPVFTIIFYGIKLRTRFDLIYYLMLLLLAIVLTEEWIFLKSIL